MPTRVSSLDRDVLSRYFLGQLQPTEDEEVEAKFMADATYFELYQEVERALLRDYAAGAMESAEAALFEQNYLVTSERRRQAAILRGLLAAQGPREVSSPPRPLIWGKLVLVPSLAVAVFAVALVWYWEHTPRPVSKTASLQQAQPRPANRKAAGEPRPPASPAAGSSAISAPQVPVSPNLGSANQARAATTAPPPPQATSQPAPQVAAATPAQVPSASDTASPQPETAPVLASAASPSDDRAPVTNETEAIRRTLMSKYPLTAATTDKTDIVTPGAILVLRKADLLTVAVASKVPSQNTYKDGKINHAGASLMKHAGLIPRVGGMAPSSPSRTFVNGEKVWVTGIDVRPTEVVFTLFTDPYFDVRYAATLSFPFPKGSAPSADQVAAMVGEVFEVQPPETAAADGKLPNVASSSAASSITPVTAPTVGQTGIATTGAGAEVGASESLVQAGTTSKMRSVTTGIALDPRAGRPYTASRLPAGNRMVTTPGGDEVRMRGDGRPAEIRTGNGMDIHRGLNGNRSVYAERRDGIRVFAERRGRGYVEDTFRFANREFAHRSYYYNGRAYDRYYGRYYYRGVYISYYAPRSYYRPAFYGWVYNPWIAPVPWAWGWAGNPWYGYYSGYFAPYPVYASASLWLTDYLISASLTAAYQAQVAAAANAAALPPDAAPLTPEVKGLIAAEVQRQIVLENAEARSAQTGPADPASSSIQRMITDGTQHVFVVGRDLDVVDATGRECAVSQGDAIQLAQPPAPDPAAATLVVLSSKGGRECRRGATVNVQFADLQEMQNHMRETIDDGMAELRAKKVSPIPQSAVGPTVPASFVAAAPPPDPNAATEINQQVQEADQAEKEALSQTQQNAGVAPPLQLTVGMTFAEVTAANGAPTKIIDLGSKKIYIYKHMKVTFKDGKVVDIN